MTLMSIADAWTPMRPNVIDDRRHVRQSIITAIEARVFHTPDAHGLVTLTYPAQTGVCYTTRFKLTPAGAIICPSCGCACDELRLHPTDRGLACPACLTRLTSVATVQAKRQRQKARQKQQNATRHARAGKANKADNRTKGQRS